MLPSYTVNAINAIILISAGLASYFLSASRLPELLAAPVLGLLLLACTYHLRRHNQFVVHTVTVVTLLAGLYFILQFEAEFFSWNNEHGALLLMGISSFVATTLYVGAFVRERRRRNNTVYKEDL